MKLVKGASVQPELSMRDKVLTVVITAAFAAGFFAFGLLISWIIYEHVR